MWTTTTFSDGLVKLLHSGHSEQHKSLVGHLQCDLKTPVSLRGVCPSVVWPDLSGIVESLLTWGFGRMMEHQTAPVPCPGARRDIAHSLINSQKAVSRFSCYCVFTLTIVKSWVNIWKTAHKVGFNLIKNTVKQWYHDILLQFKITVFLLSCT